MKRSLCALSAVAALVLAGALQAADFSYGLSTPQTSFEGPQGSAVTFSVDCSLATTNNPTDHGAQGWSLSVAAQNCEITAITIKGVIVDTVYDDDADPGTPNISAPLDLNTAGFKVAQKAADPVDANIKGVVSAIVISQTEFRVLPPEGTQVVAKLTVAATIPTGENPDTARIYYLNGLKGSGQPVNNVVTYEGGSVTPTLGELLVQLNPQGPGFYLALVPQGGTAADAGDTTLAQEIPMDEGVASQVVDVPVEVVLSSKNLEEALGGAQGWSVSVANEACLTVDSVTVKGVVVDTLYDDDADPGTPNIIAPLDLNSAGFKVAQKATGDYDGSAIPGTSGVVSAIVISQTEFRVLRPNVEDRVLKINYKITVTDKQTTNCKISFLDGLKGAGQPVNNVITYQGASKTPINKQALVVKLTGQSVVVPPPPHPFVRGDSNDDNKVNIADAVNIVCNVVPGLEANGIPIVCKNSGDLDGNGLLDLSDAIFVINFQFRGGPAPAAPFPGCGADAIATIETCPAGSTNCPAP